MEKKQKGMQAGNIGIQNVEKIALQLACELQLELVEVAMQKESRGKCLCVYLDKDGGLTLDDCEKYHKRLQPLIESVDYDFLEVSSPGIDRPIKTKRDFEKNQGAMVTVKLFASEDGSKLHQGLLHAMDEASIVILMEDGTEKGFLRKNVAVVKPVIELDFDNDEA